MFILMPAIFRLSSVHQEGEKEGMLEIALPASATNRKQHGLSFKVLHGFGAALTCFLKPQMAVYLRY